MKTKVVQCLITYNLYNAFPREHYMHELPILEVVHGKHNVEFQHVIREAEDVTPRAEFLRLKQAYAGRKDGQGVNPVDAAYPDGARDLEVVLKNGLAAYAALEAGLDELGDEPSSSDVDETEEEIELEAVSPFEDEPVLDRADVIAKLKELDVPFSGNANTQTLLAKLAAAQAEE